MISSTLNARLDVVRTARTIPAAAVEALALHLREAQEEELFRMSPLKWGRENGVPETVAIELFLRATHAGVLEFSWGVLCPWCAGFLTTPAGLRSVEEKWCALCEVRIPAEVSDNVEVAFTVAPSVRRIRYHVPESLDIATEGVRMMFSANAGHGVDTRRYLETRVVTGGRLEPHSTHSERTALQPGRYVVVVPASNTSARFRTVDGAERDDLEIELFDGRAMLSVPEVRAGRLDLTLRNKSGNPVDYLLFLDPKPDDADAQRASAPCTPLVAGAKDWLSGRRLLTSQAFHELFRAESIPLSGGIHVKGLAILFTDLQGSTQLYQRVGDLRAFEAVRAHFSELTDCVAATGGAVVKTIGDAVMAAFTDPGTAVDAAIQMHRRIRKVAPGDLALKVGLHDGPCIAVQLNERLDYFGTTVNVAARVQAKASGGEIVLTESSYRGDGVEQRLRAAEMTATREQVALKGIDGEVGIVRMRPAVDS